LAADAIEAESQRNVEATLAAAVAAGFHHVETARYYGTSELQLGPALARHPDPERILQTKIPPRDDPAAFEAELERSFALLGVERVDLLAVHGLNLPEHLEQTLRPGGCMEVLRRWQADGAIGHVGFSSHGPLELLLEAIASDAFDYINLHWYYIRQDNGPALTAARERDMGVFLISPTDKGGHLHSPSARLLELCEPLHPIVFNDLFCLSDPRVHTISVGAARPSDLDRHLQALELLEQAPELVSPIAQRLQQGLSERLGEAWLQSWQEGLPSWNDTPGDINLPVLLWLHTLLQGWDLESFAQARYGLLGNGSHWFPGRNANRFEAGPSEPAAVSEAQLLEVLSASPWQQQIPGILRQMKARLGQKTVKRLGP
jgi:predicted aldo/keto reductase-like oxidoreductase